MRTFKTKAFARFAQNANIPDALLCNAVRDAERGLIAADLGGGVIKLRLRRPGQGKSGGFRTLLVFRAGTTAIYVEGFAKNEKDNIKLPVLAALKALAKELLAYDDVALSVALSTGELIEVNCGEKGR